MVLQGIFFLLSMFAFGVIAAWLIQNDRLPPGEHTIGLLRMTDAVPHDANTRKKATRQAEMPK